MKILLLLLLSFPAQAAEINSFGASGGSSGISAATADADYIRRAGGNGATGPITLLSTFTVQGAASLATGGQAVKVGNGSDTPAASDTLHVSSEGPTALIVRDSTNNKQLKIEVTSVGTYIYGSGMLNMSSDTSGDDFGIINGAVINGQSYFGSDATPDDTLLEITGNSGVTYVVRISSPNGSTDLLTVKTSGAVNFSAKAKTFFDTAVGAVGDMFTCSDCTLTYSVCVATGTAASQWRVSGASAGCGSGN